MIAISSGSREVKEYWHRAKGVFRIALACRVNSSKEKRDKPDKRNKPNNDLLASPGASLRQQAWVRLKISFGEASVRGS